MSGMEVTRRTLLSRNRVCGPAAPAPIRSRYTRRARDTVSTPTCSPPVAPVGSATDAVADVRGRPGGHRSGGGRPAGADPRGRRRRRRPNGPDRHGRGAHVIGTASAAKHDLVANLGADELID